jgi:UDP-GlcNAc:undecaprenyl-phosphate/decaprenyl-phosphate GlcNAc-1-phosphate transferase
LLTNVPPHIALYVVGFGVALAASLGLTYAVRSAARRAGLYDPCGDRKLHTTPVPRVGGVAIFLSVALALGVLSAWRGVESLRVDGGKLAIVLAGAAAIHLLGLVDDLRNIRARWKFVAQVGIALAVALAGVQVERLSLPLVGVIEFSPVMGTLFTVAWLVAITNAFNLIDGLDGLASGAALFALTTMFVVATINGITGAATVTLLLAGATLGFLFYNFHPATIFLGDSGSLFLGFMLAGIGLLSSQKAPTVVAVAIPVVALGLPVLDTALAIVRRFLRGQAIFSADSNHIHHRLLGLGHSPKQVALLLYGVCALLALGAMVLVTDGYYVALVLVLVGAGVGFTIQRLRFYEFEELAYLFRSGARQRNVIGRRVRIREASGQVARLTDLAGVFGTLERTFAADDIAKAEVRLRRSFLETRPADLPIDVSAEIAAERRRDEELVIWNWCKNGSTHPEWWEIRLPFIVAQEECIGSLVLWVDGIASDTTLSHMHLIAGDLRREILTKLVVHRGDRRLVPETAIREPGERIVPVPLVADAPPPRMDMGYAADGDAGREPAPRPRRQPGAETRHTAA